MNSKNNFLSLLFVLVFSIHSHAQELSPAEKVELEKLEQAYSTGNCPATAANAWLFYRSGHESNYRKADTLLNNFISLQNDNPESTVYGQWAWSKGAEIGDLNVALFRAHDMFRNLWDQQNKMTSATQANYMASCRRLLEAAKRRWDTEVFDIGRDFVAYSNIFVLYVQTLTLAGDRFSEARLQNMAKSQWIRWYNHISFFGIDEFASLTYNNVIFKALMDIHDFCHDERIQKETKEIMDNIYMLQSALTHPLFKMPVTGVSRDYRVFLKEPDARSAVLTTAFEGYNPPQRAIEINENRKYPFSVIGKAAISPFIFKSYQLKDAAMGSMTGGACFQQQIHCIAVVGKDENDRAVAFIQGSNTPVNGYTDQKEASTLCVYNRLPALWHLTQWRGDLSNFRETFGEFGVGISDKWKVKSATPDHIVFEAFGYDLHVFPFSVQKESLRPCPLEMKHRTSSSPRYHPRPIIFDEYVFPDEPDWFGVYVSLVKSGVKVNNPGIVYINKDGIRSFKTNKGHQVRLFIAEKGDTKQLFNVDPAMIPLLKIGE
jgi:hypothetical protein